MLTSLELSRTQRDFLNQACQAYQQQLNETAVRYIVARGLDKAAATGLQLGVVGDPLPGHEQYVGKLCIPYLTPAGVVGLKFRCIADHDCKQVGCQRYDQPPGQQQRLYNVTALHTGLSYVGVAEGEMSAGVLSHMVGVPTVGTPGASTWLEHWPRVFADFDRVFVFEDNDLKADGSNPGRRHARKVAKAIGSAAIVVSPPEGLDPDEWYLAEGAGVIREKCGL